MPELLALDEAYRFVDAMVDVGADGYVGAAPYWHGWALRKAFLAGRGLDENGKPLALGEVRDGSGN